MNTEQTTLMGLLTKNRAVSPLPTIHPTTEAFEIGKLKVVAVDVGGHDTVRDLWEEHTIPCDAIGTTHENKSALPRPGPWTGLSVVAASGWEGAGD